MNNRVINKRLESRTPVKIKCLSWLVCRGCGLVYLNNEATRQAIKNGHVVYE